MPIVVVAILGFSTHDGHASDGVVARTTAQAAAAWIERDAGFLGHRTIVTEGASLNIRSRDSQRRIFAPLELATADLWDLPANALDLADYEVFAQRRLDGPARDFYESRRGRVATWRVQTFEAQAFERTGPTLVVVAHPWRVGRGARSGARAVVPVEWDSRGNRRLLGKVPPRLAKGQVVSFDLELAPEQAQRCALEVAGAELRLHAYTRNSAGVRHMTRRLILGRRAAPVRFRCSEAGLLERAPEVAAIPWYPRSVAAAN